MKFFFLLVLTIACSSQPGVLTSKAQDLEIYANKPADCQVVARVVGMDKNGSTELATNDALNQAAKVKATGIVVNQEVPNGKSRAVHATAYRCN